MSEETKEKPKRNPMERLLVWGLIAVGVIIACTEGTARFGYSMSLDALKARIHEDEGENPNPLKLEEAEGLIVGFPSREEGNERVTYRFKGLVKEFGAIHLPYDEDSFVLGLETDAPPEDPMLSGGEETEEGSEHSEEMEDGSDGIGSSPGGDGIGSSPEGETESSETAPEGEGGTTE